MGGGHGLRNARDLAASGGPTAVFVLLALLVLPLPAVAAERSTSDIVLVDEGAVIDDDLYAAGNRVVIFGRVNGDLVVSAFEDVLIAGTVTGDVVGVAGSVIVTGSVGESLRVVAPRIQVEGEVGGDIVVLGWNTTVTGSVAGDAVIWGWGAATAGEIGGDLEGQTRRLSLGGAVEGDVDVTVRTLSVSEGTVVGRDLGYRSPQPSAEVDRAEVGGIVVHRLPLAANVRVRALLVMAKLVLGLVAAIVGLLVMWAVPRSAERAEAAVAASWWRSWLRGLAVCLSPLLVVAVGAMVLGLAPAAAALPLVAVLIPVFLAVVGVVLAFAFAASAAVYPWLGRTGNSARSPVQAFLLAGLLVTALTLVPWLVLIVALVVIPIGVGGWVGGDPVHEEVVASE